MVVVWGVIQEKVKVNGLGGIQDGDIAPGL